MTTVYAPGAQIDHYEIIRMLGHGGMSRVYLATDLRDQRTVVLKFPNDELIGDIAVFERYRREAEIGSRLNHPYVQHLLYTDEKRSEEYLVVEYIQGKTLREVLAARDGKPLPPDEALRIIEQVCEALAYCHEHGVYHRDIKPENIMLQNDGSVKIIDFGIALLEGARRVTWRGLSGTVGTPDYMSPEQLRGQRGTASSDIYSVGMILYEMLCGHTPFEGENVFAIMNQHVSQDPPSIRQFNPNISAPLETVVMHAIRRDADKRYQSMRAMLDDLTHLDTVAPVPYTPESPRANALNRQLILGLAITGILLLIAIAIGILAEIAHNAAH
ncbi:MAG TPA: serine/threonine-protein kinase [Ktedonobacteraceae bacterium]|nr:serine/threonine-protein kinase [Ktedonobacteraceae bacterium]